MTLVSVIIPIYNASNYIEIAINSVLSQKLEFNLEIICVDDGSTDESVKQIRKLQAENNNISLYQQPNSGPAVARNLGLARAKGKYIAFLDADDYVAPNIYRILGGLIISEQADIICHGYAKVNSNGAVVRSISASKEHFYDGTKCLAYLDRIFFDFGAWAAIYSAEFLKNNSLSFPQNTNYEDSYFFSSAILRSSKTLIIPDILYFYVQNDSSRSTVWNLSNLIDCCDLYMTNIKALVYSGNDLKMREARAFISLLAAMENEQCKRIFIDYFKQKVSDDSKFIIYGTGSSGARISEILLELGMQNIIFCDSNTKYIESFNDELLVMPPENILDELYFDYKILIASCFVKEITVCLEKLGVKNEIFMPVISDFQQFITYRS